MGRISDLLDRAKAAAGLDNFGDDGFREGLERLVDSGDREAQLNDTWYQLQPLGTEGQGMVSIATVDGDIVLAVGRRSVGSAAELERALADARRGETVMLLVRTQNVTRYVAVRVGEE